MNKLYNKQKKKSIEMNIIKENDESVQIFEKTSFTPKIKLKKNNLIFLKNNKKIRIYKSLLFLSDEKSVKKIKNFSQ